MNNYETHLIIGTLIFGIGLGILFPIKDNILGYGLSLMGFVIFYITLRTRNRLSKQVNNE